jgi:F-type H+-transporting ATPase subunit b|uniref:ATP synthase subunit b n=1 Tax=Desulfobacca acetoxidans TaxID=60893 RepID=A0A7C3Z294_9BACT
MIDIDWTLFVQLLNFLVLVFLLNMVLFRPIRKVIHDRQARMSSLEGDIAGLAENRQGILGKVDEELTAARREGLSLRERLRQEGAQAEASLLEQIKKEVDAEWSRVEAKIKQDVAKAREALSAQAQDFAMALATKILGRKLS